METQGKFNLFQVTEFANWLNSVLVSRSIALVQNHHTWSPRYRDFDDNHFELLQSMERAHLERGFAEIAQNLTTFPDGTVASCRSLDKIPAGIKGANSKGICIEHVGNFDLNGDSMTPQHRNCIIKVNALLCHRFALVPNTDSIVYHHWYDLTTGQRTDGTGDTKTCPGTGFFGGNSVESARANFIPLIAAELGALPAPAPAAEVVPLYTAQVVADALNVRAQPAMSGGIVKQLPRGIFVKVYEEAGNWRRIHASDSLWVSGRFLEKALSAGQQ